MLGRFMLYSTLYIVQYAIGPQFTCSTSLNTYSIPEESRMLLQVSKILLVVYMHFEGLTSCHSHTECCYTRDNSFL